MSKKQKRIKISRKSVIVSIAITSVLFALWYYLFFPAFSLISAQFWLVPFGVSMCYCACYLAGRSIFDKVVWADNKMWKSISFRVSMTVAGISICVLLIGGLVSTSMFRSGTYAGVMKVQESEFTDEIPETENVSDIALMDSESAAIIGKRAMGELTELVSQFEVSEQYSQIDYNGKPMKVAPLEYAGFFKWMNNNSEGIPGYILVDPIENTAKYVELEKTIKYSPSSFFGKNLYRHLQMQYPTKLFGDCYFEIDNEGLPYWVCPVMCHEAGPFGAENIKGCVIMDASTGACNYYEMNDIPVWVDIVYNGELIQKQYNWYGELSGGYINSIVGNKGCKIATDDYGYKVMDGDVWIYTGVTSVNGDQSNIGFILVNSRTGECKYFHISGAEEHSAMAAAEGEVQNLRYTASFPSLINISGEPTYIMVLKDDGGLVKQYAMVNVRKYNVVATATTQKEALKTYKKLLGSNGLLSKKEIESELKSELITVRNIRFIQVENETYVYITSQKGEVFKQNFDENEELITISENDKITVYYDEKSEITIINSFSKE